MADVGRVLPRAGRREVGGDHVQSGAVPADAVNLGHEGDRVAHVLDDVVADDGVEAAVLEGPRHPVEVRDDIDAGPRVGIDPDAARCLAAPTSEINDLPGHD